MFAQNAYKDPKIMEKDLYDYIGRKDWNKILIEDLHEQLEIAFDEAYSFFKFDETIVMDGLNDFVQRFIVTTDEFTNGNPLVLKNYTKVLNFLHVLQDSTHDIQAASGVSGMATIVEDQAIEVAEKSQKTSDDLWKKALPIGGMVVAAYFILPKLLSTYMSKK